MFREAVIRFIKRKNLVLDGDYIPGVSPEELWPYDEKTSEAVVWRLSVDNDAEFCPWCLLPNTCKECLYGEHFGICSAHGQDNNYGKLRSKYRWPLYYYIYSLDKMDYVFEPIREVKHQIKEVLENV